MLHSLHRALPENTSTFAILLSGRIERSYMVTTAPLASADGRLEAGRHDLGCHVNPPWAQLGSGFGYCRPIASTPFILFYFLVRNPFCSVHPPARLAHRLPHLHLRSHRVCFARGPPPIPCWIPYVVLAVISWHSISEAFRRLAGANRVCARNKRCGLYCCALYNADSVSA